MNDVYVTARDRFEIGGEAFLVPAGTKSHSSGADAQEGAADDRYETNGSIQIDAESSMEKTRLASITHRLWLPCSSTLIVPDSTVCFG